MQRLVSAASPVVMDNDYAGPEASVLRLGVEALEKVADQLEDAQRALHRFLKRKAVVKGGASCAPILSRLQYAFGNVFVRYRRERKLTVQAVAAAIGWSTAEVASMECGDYAPNLKDLFRIASASDEEPAILFIDVVAAWQSDDRAHMTRASDFARLYRWASSHRLTASSQV